MANKAELSLPRCGGGCCLAQGGAGRQPGKEESKQARSSSSSHPSISPARAAGGVEEGGEARLAGVRNQRSAGGGQAQPREGGSHLARWLIRLSRVRLIVAVAAVWHREEQASSRERKRVSEVGARRIR